MFRAGSKASVAAIALGQGANRLLTDERSWPVASLLVLDVAGIAVRKADDPAFVTRHGASITQALLRPGHTLAELNEQYRADDWLYLTRPRPPASEGPVSFHWNEERTRALSATWREPVQRYPLAYLAGRAPRRLPGRRRSWQGMRRRAPPARAPPR